ncbi:hypothetical protein HS096_00910 [candidate division WWE3 bacterium]|jgi:tetrahydromethanopterin S-methyltransferase subunit C|uniref:Small-conductance mechanosensitive ion channel n=1 Tax=candidate division WWE3 bacterium TaxID=2053526 RepID=A0A928TQ03_UNCKA|nr:hypothetical protein [candidate division WWE3 bacterium]
MNYLNLWGATIVASLQNLWIQLLGFLPQILGAIIVLIVGVIVAGMLGKLAARVIAMAKVDSLVQSTGVTDEFRKIGISFSLSKLLGWIVKWFLIIATLIAVVDILNIGQVTLFLQDVALYIPNVIAAIVILTIGIVAGNFVRQVVHKAAEASKIPATAAGPLSAVAKWSIIIFALLAALVQLHVAAALIQTLFTGFIAMLAIAGGLAFGLGGQDKARAWLDRLDREIRS